MIDFQSSDGVRGTLFLHCGDGAPQLKLTLSTGERFVLAMEVDE